MEMRASEDMEIGEDITPAIGALCFSVNDSFLFSHCSSCFSPLPSSLSHSPSLHLLYCSTRCSFSSSADSHLLLLLHSRPSLYPHGDSSDLRLALRFLHSLPDLRHSVSGDRIDGLLTNRRKLMTSENSGDEIVSRIRDGARAMAAARRMREGLDVDILPELDDVVLEEAALCLVITNAVEVQDKSGRTLGLALFRPSFCFVNHSCSPNACYRTSLSTPQETASSAIEATPPLRIVPCSSSDEDNQAIEGVVYSNTVLSKESHCYYGPTIIVRSIKRIEKGEEVTVAYTDLLQPKAVRQSELWSRYRFICCCRRCSASPLAYVDRALEEISIVNLASSSSDISFYTDKATQRLTEYVEDAISDYLSIDGPESCCEKLEHVLAQGLPDGQLECKEGKPQTSYRLLPLHHLSLNAYTTLASAYKTRACDLLAFCSEMDEQLFEAFNMSRIGVAYSLMLAGTAQHLFHFESSLIASVANFWISAGESLLTFARSSAWSEFVEWGMPASNLFSIEEHRCSKCSLADKLQTVRLHRQAEYADFEDTTREFLVCVTNFTQQVWSYLVHGCGYLRSIKNPIDFGWLADTKHFNVLEIDFHSCGSDIGSNCGIEGNISGFGSQEHSSSKRIYMFQFGFHCVLYGGYLESMCFGQRINRG
ncbi:hypothetical protein FNV43_RR10671 [Rhamnella rubrinervis]|uniref:SET domain-containing protein n=1 Tax=Rhamnella rubrinervis TaxID=2594499 RepID=A0A8K0H4D1_9ROSA|nr:hypothetical protein FNV43_RR10671 [Rhamnella rubrinervis]